MHYVYILETADRRHWYVGVTTDLDRRLREHNTGKNPHTNKYKAWGIKIYIAFDNQATAFKFEKYLKSHSEKAFQFLI